jgi:hypothetical protein
MTIEKQANPKLLKSLLGGAGNMAKGVFKAPQAVAPAAKPFVPNAAPMARASGLPGGTTRAGAPAPRPAPAASPNSAEIASWIGAPPKPTPIGNVAPPTGRPAGGMPSRPAPAPAPASPDSGEIASWLGPAKPPRSMQPPTSNPMFKAPTAAPRVSDSQQSAEIAKWLGPATPPRAISDTAELFPPAKITSDSALGGSRAAPSGSFEPLPPVGPKASPTDATMSSSQIASVPQSAPKTSGPSATTLSSGFDAAGLGKPPKAKWMMDNSVPPAPAPTGVPPRAVAPPPAPPTTPTAPPKPVQLEAVPPQQPIPLEAVTPASMGNAAGAAKPGKSPVGWGGRAIMGGGAVAGAGTGAVAADAVTGGAISGALAGSTSSADAATPQLPSQGPEGNDLAAGIAKGVVAPAIETQNSTTPNAPAAGPTAPAGPEGGNPADKYMPKQPYGIEQLEQTIQEAAANGGQPDPAMFKDYVTQKIQEQAKLQGTDPEQLLSQVDSVAQGISQNGVSPEEMNSLINNNTDFGQFVQENAAATGTDLMTSAQNLLGGMDATQIASLMIGIPLALIGMVSMFSEGAGIGNMLMMLGGAGIAGMGGMGGFSSAMDLFNPQTAGAEGAAPAAPQPGAGTVTAPGAPAQTPAAPAAPAGQPDPAIATQVQAANGLLAASKQDPAGAQAMLNMALQSDPKLGAMLDQYDQYSTLLDMPLVDSMRQQPWALNFLKQQDPQKYEAVMMLNKYEKAGLTRDTLDQLSQLRRMNGQNAPVGAPS